LPWSRVPLAWLILTHQKRRFVLSLAGIAFAVVLMYMELGFLSALYDSQVALLQQLNADLIMSSKAKYTMAINEAMPRGRLFQARAVAGVAAAFPLYVDFEQPSWRNPGTRGSRPIRVLGFNPADPVFLIPEIQARAEQLRQPDTALVDRESQETYGRREQGTVTELSRRRLRVVGTFSLGTDFISHGNVVMSDKNFLKFFPSLHGPGLNLSRVELGLLKIAPGADPAVVADALRAALPPDVHIQTKQEFIDQELKFWRDNTPLGYMFGLGAALGFVVGMVICYQILYTDIVDHLPQFATLKAIGYRNRFVRRVILHEALLLSFLGHVPGLGMSYLLYGMLARATGLPLHLPPERVLLLAGLTIAMCTVSGILAARRVMTADPAEVFA
jgi:putative ABC transport system permease protein